MKKKTIKKSILSLALGFVFCLCSLPAVNLSNIFKSYAGELKDVYPKNEVVDINGSFATSSSSVPDKWSISSEYALGKDGDSTSFNGVIDASLPNWKDTYESINKNISDIIAANLSTIYPDVEQKNAVLNAIKTELNGTSLNSPVVHDFTPTSDIKDFKVLMLNAGKTYTKYTDGSNVDLVSQNRPGYVAYTSNEFELKPYSYYKITVWVKTLNGGKASIGLGGDFKDRALTGITTSPSSPTDVTYYFYTFSTGSSSTGFLSTTEPTSATLTYNNLEYEYDSALGLFKPKSTDPAHENYTIKYENKSETTNATNWVEHSIYVSTVNTAKATLSLSLGSSAEKSEGIVFFDDVKLERIQFVDFIKATSLPSATTLICDKREVLTNKPTSRDYTTVYDFETSHDWSIAPRDEGNDGTTLELASESYETKITETFNDSNHDGVNKVLKVDNYRSAASVIESGKFTFDQLGYYRVSLWGLSAQKNASLVVNLMSTVNNASVKATSKTSPYTSTRENDGSTSITNYWIEYTFYVKGSPLYDTEGYFNIEVSKNTIVYFDNLVVERITRADYDSAKDTLLDLSKSVLSDTVPNGRFNTYDSVEYADYSKPLPPSNWSSIKKETVYVHYNDIANKDFTKAYFKADLTFSNDDQTITLDGKEFTLSADGKTYNHSAANEKTQKIEKLENIDFSYKANKNGFYNEKYDLTISSTINAGIVSGYNNPILSPNGYTENALMIESITENTFAYKSSAIKFETNALLYNIYIDVLTDSTAKATLKLVDKDGNIFAVISDINTNNVWQTYAFYVSSGYEAKELFLELTLDNSAGTIYFKKVVYKTYSTTTLLDECKTLSAAQIRDKNIALVDLAKESFVEHSLNINSTTKLYDTNLYTTTSTNAGTYGILDTKHADPLYSSIKPKDADVSSYVLLIKNNTGNVTELKSLKTFSAVKKGYAKITVIAKVTGLEENKTATITFNKSGTTFNITSEEYTEYTLYIDNSTTDALYTTDFTIKLDGAGELVIDSISLTKETSLDTAKSENNGGKDSDTVKFVASGEVKKDETTKDTEEDKTEDKNRTLEILMAVLSSLLLVVAIVYAIIFTRVKAIKKPKKTAKPNKVNKVVDDSQKGFI